MTRKSTYVRKIADGRYEYGFVIRSDNFRKRSDVYIASGVDSQLAIADMLRSQLEINEARPAADMRQIFSEGDNTHRWPGGRR